MRARCGQIARSFLHFPYPHSQLFGTLFFFFFSGSQHELVCLHHELDMTKRLIYHHARFRSLFSACGVPAAALHPTLVSAASVEITSSLSSFFAHEKRAVGSARPRLATVSPPFFLFILRILSHQPMSATCRVVRLS